MNKKTTTEPQTANDFVRLRRGIVDHLLDGSLTWDEYTMLLHIIIRANPRTGELFTGYQNLSDETDNHHKKNRINKLMLSLKEKKYIGFDTHRGSNKPFNVSIDKYPLSSKCRGAKEYLSFSAENESDEAELQVNQQNFGARKKDLIKGFSIDRDFP